MSKAARWKIFYDARDLTYSCSDGSPEDAPTDGVVAIVEKRENKTVNVLTGDYYFWTGENWVTGHQADLERWLRGVLPRLKYGRWTKDGVFAQVMEEANRWP